MSPFFEILKYPRGPQEELLEALRGRYPEAPKKDLGSWAFLEWADGAFPAIDFDAPVRLPTH